MNYQQNNHFDDDDAIWQCHFDAFIVDNILSASEFAE